MGWAKCEGNVLRMRHPSGLTDEPWDLFDPVFTAPDDRGRRLIA